jgi:anaerobic ribonucleoside-triphosphate reductase
VYGGINFENDYCNDCGYTGTFEGECPKCGGKNIKVVKIITGYLAEINKFNPGKRAEAADRAAHC